MHLFFNMLSYYFFAFMLETRIGHWQFGVLYIASLVLSDLPSVAKHKNDYWYHSLGASGAVSAVIFSFIVYEPMTKMMIMPLPIPIPALLFGVLYRCIAIMHPNMRGIMLTMTLTFLALYAEYLLPQFYTLRYYPSLSTSLAGEPDLCCINKVAIGIK
ncbi:rhomboid family intramembrane serine protease [Mucilaginibacter humi]|uniref:rhomboid family intramembrane serine protease n=1 Tax=Mucilaginibacter humi TaxID=2732510 RepID=UPI00293BCCD4|nr:rhomboid family intramembrane serine protease [Mucilaginibacter humi]